MKVEIDGCCFSSKKEMCKKLDISYDKLGTLTYKKGLSIEQAVAALLTEKKGFIKNNIKEETPITVTEEPITVTEEPEQEEIIIEGLDTLVSNVSKYNKNKINLIDFENINSPELLKQYMKEEYINIFFYNALIHSNAYYKIIRGSKSTNIPVMIFESTSQFVDKLIIFTLGSLVTKFPKKEYIIVSKDKGYDTIINSINSLYNIKKYDTSNIEKVNKNKFIYSVCKFILNSNKITQYDRYNERELRKIFISFFKEKNKYMTDECFNGLLETIKEFNILKNGDYVMDKQYYYIDLIEASNIINTLDANKG